MHNKLKASLSLLINLTLILSPLFLFVTFAWLGSIVFGNL